MQATIHGIAKSQAQLSDFTFFLSFFLENAAFLIINDSYNQAFGQQSQHLQGSGGAEVLVPGSTPHPTATPGHRCPRPRSTTAPAALLAPPTSVP